MLHSLSLNVTLYYQRKLKKKNGIFGAVVKAQLVEWSLQTQDVCSLNPFIGKLNFEHLFTVNCFVKTKIKKKTPGMAR